MFNTKSFLTTLALATTALTAPSFKSPAPYTANTLASSRLTATGLTTIAISDNADFTSKLVPGSAFHSLVNEEGGLAKRNIGGVRMSTGPDFTGHVWYGIYALNTCIDLKDFTGNVLSFRPDEGTECLVMQGRCDGNNEFVDMFYNSTQIGDLGQYFWIGEAASYICLAE